MADNLDPKLPKLILDIHANAEREAGRLQIMDSQGFDGLDIPEVRVNYDKLGIETIYKGKYNSHIVLGRDRVGIPAYYENKLKEDPTGRKHGYGVNGFSNCSSIDLVAGVGGIDPDYFKSGNDGKIKRIGPNFLKDAARIYISQKTDVDQDFLIGIQSAAGNTTAIGASAVAVKADHVRIIGRKDIKIVTGTDSKNSKGERINFIGGIHLIGANNDTEGNLQPLVKGDNLIEFLGWGSKGVLWKMDQLAGIVTDLTDIVNQLSQELIQHKHFSPFFAIPTFFSDNAAGLKPMVSTLELILNKMTRWKSAIPLFERNYLKSEGIGYINSPLNKTN